jgi:hypothetical protein
MGEFTIQTTHFARAPARSEPERLRRSATADPGQRVADRGRCAEYLTIAGSRIGPSDRAEIHGDDARVRKTHIGRHDDASGKCNDSNRLSRLRTSIPLTHSSMVISTHAAAC